MTVEIFAPGEFDPEGDALGDFARSLLVELERFFPRIARQYHIP